MHDVCKKSLLLFQRQDYVQKEYKQEKKNNMRK